MSRLYKPLSSESFQIRLLSFAADDGSSMIACVLEIYPLLTAPSYNALSYCWGDSTVTTDIVVNELRIPITANLAAALRRARELDPSQRLWADALCINQNDDHEKSQQVKQMKDIYERAQITFSWLANPVLQRLSFLWQPHRDPLNYSKEEASTEIRALGFKHFDETQSDSLTMAYGSSQACQALLEVMQNEYWRRRWIIQELVMARQVRIMDEYTVIALEDLMTALRRCSGSDQWTTQYELASEFLQKILNFRQYSEDQQRMTLCTAILETSEFLSKDDRDRIFAVIGICSDGQDLVPLPSYHLTHKIVTMDLTRRLIWRNVNLDVVLVAASAGSTSASLPSWSPDWLSANIDRDVTRFANAVRVYPRMLANHVLRSEPHILKVQGITLGTIVHKTCPLSWAYVRASTGSCRCSDTLETDSPLPYYKSDSDAETALTKCLLGRGSVSDGRAIPGPWFVNLLPYVWHRHQVLARLLKAQPRHIDGQSEVFQVYRRWMWNHKRFMVGRNCVDVLLPSSRFFWAQFSIATVWIISVIMTAILSYYGVHTGWSLGGFIPLLLFSAYLLVYTGFVLRYFVWTQSYRQTEMRKRLEESASMIGLSDGSIGMAKGNLCVGDMVCFIAGCESLAVLRSQTDGQLTVVGRCSMALTGADKEKHSHMRNLLKEPGDFQHSMSELEQEEGWREYDLI